MRVTRRGSEGAATLMCTKLQTSHVPFSERCAISFRGLNQNCCLSQCPAVLLRALMAFLYSLSLWLTAYDGLKSLFFLDPLRDSLRQSRLDKRAERTRAALKLFSLHLYLFLAVFLFPSPGEWTGQERRELGCDIFRAAVNKSAACTCFMESRASLSLPCVPYEPGP